MALIMIPSNDIWTIATKLGSCGFTMQIRDPGWMERDKTIKCQRGYHERGVMMWLGRV